MHSLRWILASLSAAGAVLSACSGESTSPLPTSGPLTFSIVSGSEQTGRAATELPAPLVVRAEVNGKPLAGQLVNFVVTQGGGSVFAGAAITSVKGIAQEYWTLGADASAPQALEVRAVDPTTGVKRTFGTFTAAATPWPPAAWDMPGAQLIAGGVRIQSRLLDSFGNPIPGAAATASVLIYFGPGPSVGTFPSSGTTDANGIVTFTIEVSQPSSYTATVTADAAPAVQTTFAGGFDY